jgi:hypothetical protein
MVIWTKTPEGYLRVTCGWCGNEVNPSMRTGFDGTPRVGDLGFHFSCIESVEDAARTLAHNLAIAGGLCRAFYDGLDEAEDHRLYHQHGYRTGGCWMPGCLLDAIRAALEGTT